MGIFDIVCVLIFVVSVVVCACRGLSKIFAKWGAFFVAMIFSRLFGAGLGNLLLGWADVLSEFSHIIGTVLLFAVLYFVCRIVLDAVVKLIIKLVGTKLLDKVLGALVGVFVGVAAVSLFGFAVDFISVIADIFDAGSDILHMASDTVVFRYFIK